MIEANNTKICDFYTLLLWHVPSWRVGEPGVIRNSPPPLECQNKQQHSPGKPFFTNYFFLLWLSKVNLLPKELRLVELCTAKRKK